MIEGRVTRLSGENAEIEAPQGAPAFANLKLQLVDSGHLLAGYLYAKVSSQGSSSGVFMVRFTSVPPQVRSFIKGLRATGYASSCNAVL